LKLLLPMFLLAVSPMLAQEPEWQRVRVEDPLRKTSFDSFVLEGSYLAPPAAQVSAPSLEVLCSKNKLHKAYVHFGGAIRPEPGMRSLKGNRQAKIDVRADDRRFSEYLEISEDRTTVSADNIEFTELLTGHLFRQHPENEGALVHRLIIGNIDAIGVGVMIQFDMPADQQGLISACGLAQGKKKK